MPDLRRRQFITLIMLAHFWTFLQDESNRVLGWLGGNRVVLGWLGGGVASAEQSGGGARITPLAASMARRITQL